MSACDHGSVPAQTPWYPDPTSIQRLGLFGAERLRIGMQTVRSAFNMANRRNRRNRRCTSLIAKGACNQWRHDCDRCLQHQGDACNEMTA